MGRAKGQQQAITVNRRTVIAAAGRLSQLAGSAAETLAGVSVTLEEKAAAMAAAETSAQASRPRQAAATPPAMFTEVPDLRISYDQDGYSIGQYVVGAREKEVIDLARNSLALGDRALLVHGGPGQGKTAFIEQLAAIVCLPLVTVDNPVGESPQPVRIEVTKSDGSSEMRLVQLAPTAQARLTAALAQPAVIHFPTPDADLQEVLALARRHAGSTRLTIGHSAIAIDPDATLVFEVTVPDTDEVSTPADRAPAPPELQFAAVKNLSALELEDDNGLQITRTKHPAKLKPGSSASEVRFVPGGAAPEPRVFNPTDRNLEDAAVRLVETVRAVARAQDTAVEPTRRRRVMREQVLRDVQTGLAKLNPEMAGPDGREFVDHWLENMELQAYMGDSRADRTARRQLRAATNSMHLSWLAMHHAIKDALPSLQSHNDEMYNFGAVARGGWVA